MHPNVSLTGPDLLRRAARIRLPDAAIARAAGIDKHTVARLRRSDRVQARTVAKVREVVLAEEARLFRHLFDLYRDEVRP